MRNKRKLFFAVFAAAVLALGGWTSGFREAKAGDEIYCYTDLGITPTCMSNYESCIFCSAYTSTCTVNAFNFSIDDLNTLDQLAQCTDGKYKCQAGKCPDNNTDLTEGDPCQVRKYSGGVRVGNGNWDLDDKKCVICAANNVELSVCGSSGPTGTINLAEVPIGSGNWQCSGAGDAKFESACGADAACDEQVSGFVCEAGKACDATGQCIAVGVCTYNNPTVTLTPATLTGAPGSTKSFTVSVTNSNTVACASETFTLAGTVPGGWNSAFSPVGTITLNSGGLGTRNFDVTSAIAAVPGNYNVSVTGTGGTGGKTGTGSGIFIVSAGGFASYKDAGIWYSLKCADSSINDCLTVCPAGTPPAGCSSVGDCQTAFDGSVAACCAAWASCVDDLEACDCAGAAEICNNGIDDNANSLIDCKDVGFCPVGALCVGGGTCIAVGTCCGNGPCDTGETVANCPADCGGGACVNSFCEGALGDGDTGCLCGTHIVTAAETAANGWCCSAVNWVAVDQPTCQAADPLICGAGACPACANGIMDCGETGIDCGGGGCPACATGPTCAAGDGCLVGCALPDPDCAAAISPSRCDPNAWKYCNPLEAIKTISQAAEEFLGYVLGLIGSVALLFIIIAGLMYMTSAGSEDRIATSKRILTGAVIGLGVALLAYSLLQVIITVLGV